MFKRFIFGLAVFLFAVSSYAQPANAIGMLAGKVESPWSDFSLSGGITSQSYSLLVGPRGVPAITWQTIYTSAPTSVSVSLQASTDGTSYSSVDTSTSTTGEVRTIFGTHKFLRFIVNSTSGGTSPTITVRVVYSSGDAVSTTSGAIYGGGTFTGPILLPDGSATAPAVASSITSSGNYTGFYFDGAQGSVFVTSAGIARAKWNGPNMDLLQNTSQIRLGASVDLILARDAANTLALRNGTNAQTFNIYNTYTDASNYERFKLGWDSNEFKFINDAAGTGVTRGMRFVTSGAIIFSSGGVLTNNKIEPTSTDTISVGSSTFLFQSAYLSRSIQGSKSKTLVDNVSTSFVRLSVADDDYEGCRIIWTAFAEDADTDARQTRTGSNSVAILNNSGTETAAFSASADDQVVVVTAGTISVNFSSASAATDTIDLYVSVNTSLDAAAETLTFEWRLDCPSVVTVTPQ